MAELIRMPRMSDTMEEGTIVEWHKKVGEPVKPGDVLAEVETDKATMELESFQEGTLLYIGVQNGDSIPVDAILAILGEKGEDFQSLIDAEPTAAASESNNSSGTSASVDAEPKAVPVAEPAHEPTPTPTSSVPVQSESNGRLKASPLAKKIAADSNVDIAAIEGSGGDGRIIKRDVEKFIASGGSAPSPTEQQNAFVIPQVVGQESFEEVKVSQMRKTIARRLAESKFSAPHFYLNMEIDMSKAMEARKSMNEVSPIKISFNDLIVKAAAMALRQNPKANSSWLEDKIRYNKHIHIGVAVAVDEGLLVPVLRFADSKSLSHIGAETKELAGKAKSRKLQPEEMEGNTFTISNLGMFDIDHFTAIINPPDACILAVGKIAELPVVKDGEIVVGHKMKVTLSCDHRVVDGAIGSQFLLTLKQYLEDPVRLLV